MTDSRFQPITETVTPAGLRARAEIQRGILDESCARHLELAADEIERLRAELVSCRACHAKLDCLSRGENPPTDDLRTQLASARKEGIEVAVEIVGAMRQAEAGMFDEKHSGQRGCDRSDALYDAYLAIGKALSSKPKPPTDDWDFNPKPGQFSGPSTKD